MHIPLIVVQGLFELLGLGGFLFGFFLDTAWVMIIGGVLIVLDDFLEIVMGVLNPLFPLVLAVMLALAVSPWYVGVGIFWASAAFKVIGIPTSLTKIFKPGQVLAKIEQRLEGG